jgi:hypothetical protein
MEERPNPETATTWEFLDEHLYQVALRGGYQAELERVRPHLPELAKFADAREFMKELRRDAKLRQTILRELHHLWQSDYQLRPATGALLMLAMRVNAPAANEDYWYEFFVELGKGGGL